MTLALWTLLSLTGAARGAELPEYRVKAAFVYNFIIYTQWPPTAATTLKLCIEGSDPISAEIDTLQGKIAGGRTLMLMRTPGFDPAKDCNALFIAASAMAELPRLLENLRGRLVLTVADSAGAMERGVSLNLNMTEGMVSFEANLQAARRAGLELSSKLLRLATEVRR